MNDVIRLFQDAGALAYLQLAVTLPLLIVALGCAVAVGLGRRVPPAVAALACGVSPLVALVGLQLDRSQVNAALPFIAASDLGIVRAMGEAEALANPQLAVLAALGGGAWVLGAVFGGVRAPRSYGVPAVQLVLSLAAIGALALAAVWAGSLTQLAGCGLLTVLAVGLALASANAQRAGGGPEAGATAAVGFVSALSAVAIASHVATAREALKSLVFLPELDQPVSAEVGARLSTDLRLTAAALLLASLTVVVAALRPTVATDAAPDDSALRRIGRLLALLAPLAWLLLFASLQTSASFAEAAEAIAASKAAEPPR